MSRTLTFDTTPPAGTINMGIGQPSLDLLPVDLLKRASEAFFLEAQPPDMNYGPPEGDERFLEALATYLSEAEGQPTSPDLLLQTGGNSQSLDMVSHVFAKPGDTVFVEDPSYFLAFQIFKDHDLNIVGIPLEEDGISIAQLEQALEQHKPAFLYTIPSFQNPSGLCMSLAKRNKLIELARSHNFLIVADEVYQLLYYYDRPPPAFGTLVDSEVVISLGSFSKILAPGLRLGWVQTTAAHGARLLSSGLINSGGCINQFASHFVRQAISLGLLEEHVALLRQEYRSRLEAMDRALKAEFGSLAQWSIPQGGYFFWIRIAADCDIAAIRERAREQRTGFQPGAVFSVNGQFSNYLRLSFAHYSEAEIEQGIRRMRPLFD